MKRSNKNFGHKKRLILLILTNLISFGSGAFIDQESIETEKIIKLNKNEVLINIPSKIFLPHQKIPMNVTIKTSDGHTIFKQAKITKISPTNEKDIYKSSIIVKKELLTQEINLNHTYFQVTPYVEYSSVIAEKNVREIYEIIF